MEKHGKIMEAYGNIWKNHGKVMEHLGTSHNLWPMFMGQIGKKHLEIVEICRNHL